MFDEAASRGDLEGARKALSSRRTDGRTRQGALTALCQHGDQRDVERVLELVSKEDSSIEVLVLSMLAGRLEERPETWGASVVRPIYSRIESAGYGNSAASVLATDGRKESIDFLADKASDAGAHDPDSYARALGIIGGPQVVILSKGWLKSGEHLRAQGSLVLGVLGGRGATKEILKAVRSHRDAEGGERPETAGWEALVSSCMHAVSGLYGPHYHLQQGVRSKGPAGFRGWKDGDQEWLTGEIVRGMRSSHSHVRLLCVSTSLDDPVAIRPLLRAIEDPVLRVRRAAKNELLNYPPTLVERTTGG